jgi:type I restriction enzyme S subunit
LGEICKTTSGGTPNRANKDYYNGNILWVKSGELDKGIIYDTEEKITQEAINASSAKVFPKGTLLIALYGATIGKLAFLGADAATNQAICGIYQNEKVDSKYLYYYLFYKKRDLVNQGIGGAQPNISQTILKNLEVPLPTLPTQLLIISKIEELFSELDKGIENLKTAQQQLKVYRQAALKWAFEGKLTESLRKSQTRSKDFVLEISNARELNFNVKLSEWQKDKSNEKGNKDVKPQKPSNLDLRNELLEGLVDKSSIPSEWNIVPLVFISDNQPNSIVDGPFGSSINVNEDYIENGIPVIRMVNIRPLKFVDEQMKFIKQSKFESLRRHNILPGDVLIAKVGATIGDCCIYPGNQPEGMLSTTGSCRVRVDRNVIDAKFLEYYVFFHRNTFKNIASQTAQPFLNMKVVKSFPIVLTAIDEQFIIVQEIESRFSVADKMEESINDSLKQAEALRQSILKKAFEGKLLC